MRCAKGILLVGRLDKMWRADYFIG